MSSTSRRSGGTTGNMVAARLSEDPMTYGLKLA